MVPERLFTIRASDAVPLGTYPFRVVGEVVGNEEITAVGRAMDSMGGITELYNFPRRPVPQTAFTVIEPGAMTVELDAKEDKGRGDAGRDFLGRDQEPAPPGDGFETERLADERS